MLLLVLRPPPDRRVLPQQLWRVGKVGVFVADIGIGVVANDMLVIPRRWAAEPRPRIRQHPVDPLTPPIPFVRFFSYPRTPARTRTLTHAHMHQRKLCDMQRKGIVFASRLSSAGRDT